MKKSLITLITLSILSALFAGISYADTNCQSVYGGGQSCGPGNITVQKQVLKPGTSNDYVDSLGFNDAKYQPASPIFFKITITNTTKNTLNNIIVTDKMDTTHEFLNFVSGAGTYNTGAQTLTYKIPTLTPGQQNVLTLSGRILQTQQLPFNQAVICAGNTVQVTVDKSAPTLAVSSYCIQNTSVQTPKPTATQAPVEQTTKGGIPLNQIITQAPTVTPSPVPTQQVVIKPAQTFPVYTAANNMTKTPKSGPEALPLLAMIPAGGIGFWLRKKAK